MQYTYLGRTGMKDSCYIRLQKEPIDAFNNQHMEFQNKINRMLNL